MFRIVHAGVFVALMAAAGCQHLPVSGSGNPGSGTPSTHPEVMSDIEHRQLIALLDYYERTSDMDYEALRQRLAILEPRVRPGRCTAARIRFAMLLTRLPPGEGAGGGILAPCTPTPRAGTTAEDLLAPVLRELIAARHARAETHARAQALEDELANTKAENGKLREQIEGLKAIEESLQERATPEEE